MYRYFPPWEAAYKREARRVAWEAVAALANDYAEAVAKIRG
jgi:hypothetical protein